MAVNVNPTTAQVLRQELLRGHLHSAGALFDEASVLHVSGESGLAGQYQGREAILALSHRLALLTGGTLRFTPTRVLVDTGAIAVVHGREQARRAGTRLDAEALYVIVFRGSCVGEFWILHDHQSLVDEFWTTDH